jgi:hypothetical protein
MNRNKRLGWAALVTACGVALATTTATPARAFCGFYVGGADAKLFNNATQVVLMREGTRTILSMQNNYEGPAENFAMVVPVPVVLQKENVKTLPRDLFARIDTLSAPRLVEYWEQDPCATPEGGGGRADRARMPMRGLAAPKSESASGLGVTIEAQFTVGEYEIVILSAKDSTGLETWLKQQKYAIPEGAAPYFKPYIQSGSKFFVAKVDASKVKLEKGMAMLSPLRFHYDSETFSLPVRLGLMNAKGAQDLIVHILAKGQRYEVANYPNVTVPTNYDVAENAKADFGAFYASLFDKTVEATPKAVVTEYSWDSGTCDPCPGPTLSPADLQTLGGDVLPQAETHGPKGAATSGKPITPRPPPTIIGPGPGGRPMPGRPFFRPMPRLSGFTLTRLHARYTKENLGEDLVFRTAPPITGGREVRSDGTELEHGSKVTEGGTNNFQGRYAIRHPWAGPVTCENPRRGIWGGPPASLQGDAPSRSVTTGKDLAFAPRGGTPLASYMRSRISELAIDPAGAPVSPAPVPSSAVPSATTASGTASSDATSPGAAKSGCGCAAADDETFFGGGFAVSVGAFGLLLTRARRRRTPDGDPRCG